MIFRGAWVGSYSNDWGDARSQVYQRMPEFLRHQGASDRVAA